MKKIVLLIDAQHFKTETLDFAAYIARVGKAKLVGVFIEDNLVPALHSVGGHLYVEEITGSTEERKEKSEICKKNIQLFLDGCTQREVSAVVHHFNGSVLRNCVHESRYADLIILDPEISFTGNKTVPSRFATEFLNHIECPVIIAPEYFEPIDEVVLAYDGSRSSVFAIKQFYYQLTEFADKKITVLHINERDDHKNHDLERNEFNEWLEMHFQNVVFDEICGDASDVLLKYFIGNEQQHKKLLVTGAFGRNLISSFFKPSTANILLKTVDMPIFIAHH